MLGSATPVVVEPGPGPGHAARRSCRQFEPDGSIRYRAPAGGTDYGRTHFCDEASGLTAAPVAQLLEAAAFAGDQAMVEEGLRLLRILQKRFDHGVPRGAQTWEIPLHTPDILGSAYLVKAFALGYELTGDPDAARGRPVLGLDGRAVRLPGEPDGGHGSGRGRAVSRRSPCWAPPTGWPPTGSACPCSGAAWSTPTAWSRLARLDPTGPWSALADGIAASGILQTYPMDHPHHGLLPDSFNLGPQSRNPADINPGTLQPPALRLLAGDRPAAIPYEFRALRRAASGCTPRVRWR